MVGIDYPRRTNEPCAAMNRAMRGAPDGVGFFRMLALRRIKTRGALPRQALREWTEREQETRGRQSGAATKKGTHRVPFDLTPDPYHWRKTSALSGRPLLM